MTKVFLGGTCNGSKWREELIDQLEIDYFNPVVDDWNTEAQLEEIRQREICDFCLYTITPGMKGVYSIAEVVDDSNKRPDKTIFCLLETFGGKTFQNFEMKSLKQVAKMVRYNGAEYFGRLDSVAKFLNSKKQEK